ncbi:unnamed protein product, partial [Didymodactylos carnosus]
KAGGGGNGNGDQNPTSTLNNEPHHLSSTSRIPGDGGNGNGDQNPTSTLNNEPHHLSSTARIPGGGSSALPQKTGETKRPPSTEANTSELLKPTKASNTTSTSFVQSFASLFASEGSGAWRTTSNQPQPESFTSLTS